MSVEPRRGFFDLVLERLDIITTNLVAEFIGADGRPEGEAVVFKGILCLDSVSAGIVLRLVLFSILHHSIDFFLRQSALVIGDGNLVLLSSTLFDGRYIENTICIKVERHFDLRLSTRHWRNAVETELAQSVVVASHGTFAFKDLDEHTRLVICKGREDLRFFGRNCSIAWNQSRHDTTSCLETEGKRSHI
mmetsp:Transcript_6734/g.12329  ORF Transcript_6734/g.12329 Transcript_6734/m.12329 type:complete len:191 (+) Transcript_6734:1024-1596(+)